MGLPRYAKDLKNEMIEVFLEDNQIEGLLKKSGFCDEFGTKPTEFTSRFFIWAFRVSQINYTEKEINYSNYYSRSEKDSFNVLFGRAFKRAYRLDTFRGEKDDSFNKYYIDWFVAWYRDSKGNLKKETVRGVVNKWFLKKARAINKERAEEEKATFIERETFQRLTTRIYTSRNFPPKLRELIFIRDNYTCQNCGINKDNCLDKGLRLEAHHIIAYEDGGETCYENGLTLCSDCNKGVHHTKELVEEHN